MTGTVGRKTRRYFYMGKWENYADVTEAVKTSFQCYFKGCVNKLYFALNCAFQFLTEQSKI